MKRLFAFFLALPLPSVAPFSWTPYYRKAPIVFAQECKTLQHHLSHVSCGNQFLLITDLGSTSLRKPPTEIRDNLRFILQLSLLLRFALSKPVVQIDTSFTKHLSDESMVMDHYDHDVVQSLNLVRGFLSGKISDLAHIHDWDIVRNPRYDRTLSTIHKSMRFLSTFSPRQSFSTDHYFIGHQLGVLPYEEAMRRNDSMTGHHYACSSHFLWVDPVSHHHVAFLEGVENPIGIIVNDSTPLETVVSTITKLNPKNDGGRVTVMVRMSSVKDNLPPLLEAVSLSKYAVTWCCDVSHRATPSAMKHDLHQYFRAHKRHNTLPGGMLIGKAHCGDKDILDLVQYTVDCMDGMFPSAPVPKQPWNHFSQ